MTDTDHRPSNFIRQIIDNDLVSGKYQSVQMRFPPEPNGYLHIGHAKSICLNFGIAKDYGGSCNLRFDDTNPAKEDIDYVHSIQEDVKWLGFKWSGDVRYSSNYFDQLYQFAIELIKKGKAFVCFLDSEQMRAYRGTLTQPGVNSPYRDTSVAENLKLFEKMRNGEFKEGECSLRAKIDMSSSFMCMRDPIIYRIRFIKHHQTGDKWCIYPMYDFTHCISDAIEGVTHSLCTLEFQDNRRLYDWVLAHISIDVRPEQTEFSRLNLEYTLMSKRQLASLVEQQVVDGWDDPRMPTIAGLRRRGYPAAAIREFCRRIGVTKQENMVELGMLEACVREELNDHAPRAMAVLNPIKVIIENYPQEQSESLTAPNHPNIESMGSRQLPFGRELYIEAEDFQETANKRYKRLVIGKEVRLRNAYVIKALRCEKDAQGNVTKVYCQYDPDTLGKAPADGRKPKGVIHWVSAVDHIRAEVRLYDRLFKVANPASEPDFKQALDPNSLVIINSARLEKNLATAPQGVAYQFERLGYFCKDNHDPTHQGLVFNRTISLRDTWDK